MKKWMLGLFAIGILNSAFLYGDTSFDLQKKIYVPKEHIQLDQSQIFVINSATRVPITNLSVDSNGFYTIVSTNDSSLFQWECPECGHDNWFWEDYCWFCGYEQ